MSIESRPIRRAGPEICGHARAACRLAYRPTAEGCLRSRSMLPVEFSWARGTRGEVLLAYAAVPKPTDQTAFPVWRKFRVPTGLELGTLMRGKIRGARNSSGGLSVLSSRITVGTENRSG